MKRQQECSDEMEGYFLCMSKCSPAWVGVASLYDRDESARRVCVNWVVGNTLEWVPSSNVWNDVWIVDKPLSFP